MEEYEVIHRPERNRFELDDVKKLIWVEQREKKIM